MKYFALTFFAVLRFLLPPRAARFVLRRKLRRFLNELKGQATDQLLELLLYAMSWAFLLSSSYRINIQNYTATLVFRCKNSPVAAAARFHQSHLEVETEPSSDGNTCISFASPAALQRFIFAKDHDALNLLLKNEVTVTGNVNHVYRFGFLANELLWMLDMTY